MTGVIRDRKKEAEKIRHYTDRKLRANLLCSLSPIPLLLPFCLLALPLLALDQAKYKLCPGTSGMISGREHNLCKVPDNVNEVKVFFDTYREKEFITALFDQEPPLSDTVTRVKNKRMSFYISEGKDYNSERINLVKGSSISFNLKTERGEDVNWFWSTSVESLEDIKNTAIASGSGNTFNLTYTANETKPYYMAIYKQMKGAIFSLWVEGHYDLNRTYYDLDSSIDSCTNKTVCVFKKTAGKVIISMNFDSYASNEKDEITIGKDYDPAMPSIISVSVLMVVCLIAGIVMIYISCHIKAQLKRDRAEIEQILKPTMGEIPDKTTSPDEQEDQTRQDTSFSSPPEYVITDPTPSGSDYPN